MKRIDSISIKNFKFASGEVRIDLSGKISLMYGQNGSGKSTIFWALYTFFESSFKGKEGTQKYFDDTHDENLVNRYMDNSDTSHVKLGFIDDDHTKTEKVISLDTTNTDCDLIKEACISSDFVNYRFLSRMYDFRNSENIDIFPTISKDILQYSREEGSNLGELWEMIKNGLGLNGKVRYPMKSTEYKEYTKLVDEFNRLLSRYLQRVVNIANDIITQRFNEQITINIKISNAVWNALIPGTKSRNYELIPPVVHLSVSNMQYDDNVREIKRPHTHLNEGRLTLIFLAIRLAMSRTRPKTTELSFTVIDDLLLSLDMSNRMTVLETVLSEYSDRQLIILTHDLGFYNMIKTYYDVTNWKLYKLRPDTENLQILDDKTDDEIINEFLINGDYETCAGFLRKKLEKVLKAAFKEGISVLDMYSPIEKRINKASNELCKKELSDFTTMLKRSSLTAEELLLLKTDYMSDSSLSENKKSVIKEFHNNLINYASASKRQKDNLTSILKEIKKIMNRLHAGAHDNINMPHYQKEIIHAIRVIKRLEFIIMAEPYKYVAPKVKKIVNKEGDNDVIQAIEGLVAGMIEDYLNNDTSTDDLLHKIVELSPTLDSKKFDLSFDYLFINRLDDMKFLGLDEFFASLVRDRELTNEDRDVIGKFVAQILNAEIKLNERVFDKLSSKKVLPAYVTKDGSSYWIYNLPDSPF